MVKREGIGKDSVGNTVQTRRTLDIQCVAIEARTTQEESLCGPAQMRKRENVGHRQSSCGSGGLDRFGVLGNSGDRTN